MNNMHIIISPRKVPPSCSHSSSMIVLSQDPIFVQKQTELRNRFVQGGLGINDLMEQMYLLGKKQGVRNASQI